MAFHIHKFHVLPTLLASASIPPTSALSSELPACLPPQDVPSPMISSTTASKFNAEQPNPAFTNPLAAASQPIFSIPIQSETATISTPILPPVLPAPEATSGDLDCNESSSDTEADSVKDCESKSVPKFGFEWDAQHDYNLEWALFAEFKAWLLNEQNSHAVEYVMREHHSNKAPISCQYWEMKHIYVCSHKGSGGVKKYKRKMTHKQKMPHKHLEGGCRSSVWVKMYPGTTILCG
ncbi:hypothetical protein ARMGADRAFT_1081456 [Armillaria gallica]|uniref:FAR1 domain-containing protein n=1 Tax=Armillaria gallica TaxID=47427 RepID=A0A2H3DME7_ARMGA|nr:hypothetical protein ARMGADRAFT_1081456 [Armillaria gallica]